MFVNRNDDRKLENCDVYAFTEIPNAVPTTNTRLVSKIFATNYHFSQQTTSVRYFHFDFPITIYLSMIKGERMHLLSCLANNTMNSYLRFTGVDYTWSI
mmetsp:Transcript_1091/g.2346  ORF Transcript_1091/g.2346 Transcript_1091/m.2346 type:complete len:99 (-) Transcript_1091:378-674(-)